MLFLKASFFFRTTIVENENDDFPTENHVHCMHNYHNFIPIPMRKSLEMPKAFLVKYVSREEKGNKSKVETSEKSYQESFLHMDV